MSEELPYLDRKSDGSETGNILLRKCSSRIGLATHSVSFSVCFFLNLELQ